MDSDLDRRTGPVKHTETVHKVGNLYNLSKKRGCPTCAGVDPKSCVRCFGKTRMCDWLVTDTGWQHRKTVNANTKEK